MRYSLVSMVGMATFFRYFLFHVMAPRFLSSSEDEIRQLLEEKDFKNTKRTYKVSQQVFHEYLLEKGIAEPTEKTKFFRYHVYFLRLQCIIKQLSDSVFVICKIINVSVRVICLTFRSADNSYLDIDNSAYHITTVCTGYTSITTVVPIVIDEQYLKYVPCFITDVLR